MERHARTDYERMVVAVCYLNNLTWSRQHKKEAIFAHKLENVLVTLPAESYNERIICYGVLANFYLDTRQIDQAYHYADLQAAIPAESRTPVNYRAS